MPATAAAFARGELSTDKVDELCQANAKKRRARSAEAEERLVADAKRLGFADLQNVLAMRRNAADAEAANDSAQRHQPGQRPPPLRPHDRHRPGRSTPATSPPDLADEPDDEWNDPPVDTIDTGGPVETTEPVDGEPDRGPPPEPGP